MAANDIIVHCHVSGGLTLQLCESVKDEFGYDVMRRIGDVVTLNFGDNHGIDAAFMDAWAKQYAQSALLAQVSVRPAEAE